MIQTACSIKSKYTIISKDQAVEFNLGLIFFSGLKPDEFLGFKTEKKTVLTRNMAYSRLFELASV